jgi:hypothetical protein
MRAARIVNHTCSCGWTGSVCLKRAAGWAAKCPECGKVEKPERPKAPRYYGDRRFAGTERESVMHGFHPDEVGEARRLLPAFQECIRDDGTVQFDSRKQERGFVKAQDALRPA